MSISTSDRKFGEATEEQWSKMQNLIKSDKYKKEDFFVFDTIAVGDREVPNRFQRITRSALEVMAQDAKKGVSLMLNHNEGQLGVQAIPLGKVFDGRIEEGKQDGEANTLILSHYILRDDSKIDGYSKNDIIKLIETGIIEDTSVAFTIPYETATCSICGKPYFSGKCTHIRGNYYELDEQTGATRQCIVEINPPTEAQMSHNGNAMLSENSLVYDGAYPNATIQQSANGEYVDTTNGRYKVLEEKETLSNSKLIGFATSQDMKLMYKPFEKGGVDIMDKEVMDNEAVEAVEETVEQATEETVETTEVTEGATETATESATESDTQAEAQAQAEPETEAEPEAVAEVEQKQTETEAFSITKAELENIFGQDMSKEEVLKFAKAGQKYREKVIEDALKSGVRAMGNNFDKESFRKTFEKMEVEDIVSNAESFEKSVTEKFGNGRVSEVKPNKVQNSEDKYAQAIDLTHFKTGKY